jgi:hypothetical protein
MNQKKDTVLSVKRRKKEKEVGIMVSVVCVMSFNSKDLNTIPLSATGVKK